MSMATIEAQEDDEDLIEAARQQAVIVGANDSQATLEQQVPAAHTATAATTAVPGVLEDELIEAAATGDVALPMLAAWLVLEDEIIEAAATGDVAVVAAWLDSGGHIDVRERKCNDTLLMRASGNGQLLLVELLLNRGASIDLQNSVGFTALMAAVNWGEPIAVPLLLQAGARTDLCDEEGRTALQLTEATATHPAKTQYVKKMAAEAARLLHQYATTPLAQAASAAEVDIAEVDIAERAPLPAAAIRAASSGDVDMVVAWLDGDGHVDACAMCTGGTMLITASGHGNVTLVELLLSRGANADLRSATGDTALIVAALFGQPSVATLLLRAGARTDLLDADGHTVLQIAEGVAGMASLPTAQRQGAAKVAQLLYQYASPTPQGQGAAEVTQLLHQHTANANVSTARVGKRWLKLASKRVRTLASKRSLRA